MSKIGVISLHDSEIINNLTQIFPDAVSVSFYKLEGTLNVMIEKMEKSFDKLLIVNGLEELDNEYIFSFKYSQGQDTEFSQIKISNLLEELICNEEYNAVNTDGIFIKTYPNQSDKGVYFKSEELSKIYITFNALKNMDNLYIPHFNIVYNDPYKHKIAICLWGDLSAWSYVKDSFKNNIQSAVGESDIFVFIDKDKEENIKELVEYLEVKKIGIANNSTEVDREIINFLQSNTKNKNSQKIISDYHQIVMQYNCNQLRREYEKTNNIKYDVIVNCNLNLFYFNSLDLTYMKQNTVFTCYGINCNNLDPYFFLAEPYVIDKICDNFSNNFSSSGGLTNIKSFWEKNGDEEFSIYNTILLTLKENNFNIGKKLINCSLHKDNNTFYKHPNKWIYLSNDQKAYLYNYLGSIGDIFKIQKIKDEIPY